MEITTPRLLLREYAADDLPAMLAYTADPRHREFYGPDGGSPEQVRALLALFTGWAAEEPRLNFQLAVTVRGTAAGAVGSAGLRMAGLPAGEAELGVELAAPLWGRGYAAEAARALLEFGFTTLGLRAVRAGTVSANARAAALVRRLGFQPVPGAEGPAWMSARGWTAATWRLTRAGWAPRRTT